MKRSEYIDRNQFFYTTYDEMVEQDSFVRYVDKYIQSIDLKLMGFTEYDNIVGRPAYDPRVLISLILYGCMEGCTTSRKLESKAKRDVEYLWLLGGAKPDHSTIAKFKKNNCEAFSNLFYDFVDRCIKSGLISGDIVAVDGTKVRAYNSKKNNYSEKTLKRKIESLERKIQAIIKCEKDKILKEELSDLIKRKKQYLQYLEELQNSGDTQISTIDTDARLMDNKRGGLDVGYNVQATVDNENALVVDTYVTNKPADNHELATAALRAKEILSEDEITILADKGYYEGENLQTCFDNGITPIVSKQAAPHKAGRFSMDDYHYNEDRDSFTCPNGAELTRKSKEDAKQIIYSNREACKDCPFKDKCFKSNKRQPYKSIIKNQHFKTYRKADALFEANIELYHRRQELNEHVFGSVKRQIGFPIIYVRGIRSVSAEFCIHFLCYNIKRVINIIKNKGSDGRLIDKILRYLNFILNCIIFKSKKCKI